MKRIPYIIFSTIILLGFLPSTSFALLSASVSLDPKNPSPNSSVTLTLVSYSFDVNQSTITWTSNGKELSKGLGQKRLVVNTGDIGINIPIQVSAVTEAGEAISMNVNVNPQSVNILYESEESYVPLFYEGLALPGEGSLVKFVAMPNISVGGSVVSPSSLSYSWSLNGNFMDEASGIGKQTALFPLSLLAGKTEVKVLVTGPGGTTAEKTITVFPHAVLSLLYYYDDTLGVKLNNLISRRLETTKTFTLSFEPYYLSIKGPATGGDTYSWLLDGSSVTPFGGKLLTLRPKENSYGSNKLSITASNKLRRLQNGEADLELIFDTRK